MIRQITNTATFKAIQTDPKVRSYWVVGTALVFATIAPIGMRAAQQLGMPFQAVVFWRLFPAFIILTPFVLRRYRHQLAQIGRRDSVFITVAGILLGVHFNFLAASLAYTSILVSQVITNTGPIWVALLEMTFLKEKLGCWVIIGIVIAFAGGIIIALAPSIESVQPVEMVGRPATLPDPNPLLGGLLGLGAAIGGAVYLLIGRRVRSRVSLLPYIWMVYGVASVTGVMVSLLSQEAVFGYVVEAFLWTWAVALFVTLLGHGAFNYAVGYLPATIVSIASQIISVLAAIVAFIFFSEMPLMLEIVGSMVIVAGVVLSIVGQRRTL